MGMVRADVVGIGQCSCDLVGALTDYPAVDHRITSYNVCYTKLLRLTLEASGDKEILSWLYSYLPHVEVLQPSELRAQFIDGLRSALDAAGHSAT